MKRSLRKREKTTFAQTGNQNGDSGALAGVGGVTLPQSGKKLKMEVA